MTKVCGRCKLEKETIGFSLNKKGLNGLSSCCKVCRAAKQREWNNTHKQQIKEMSAKYYQENKDNKEFKEKQTVSHAKYYQENKEKIAARTKKHRQENKETYAARNKKYQQENKEKIAARSKEYYQKNKNKLREQINKYGAAHKVEACVRSAKHYQNNKIKVLTRSSVYYQNHKEEKKVHTHKRRARIAKVGGKFTKADIINMHLTQWMRCYYCSVSIEEKYHIDHMTPISRSGSNWIDNICLTCVECNLSKHIKTAEEFIEQKGFMHGL